MFSRRKVEGRDEGFPPRRSSFAPFVEKCPCRPLYIREPIRNIGPRQRGFGAFVFLMALVVSLYPFRISGFLRRHLLFSVPKVTVPEVADAALGVRFLLFCIFLFFFFSMSSFGTIGPRARLSLFSSFDIFFSAVATALRWFGAGRGRAILFLCCCHSLFVRGVGGGTALGFWRHAGWFGPLFFPLRKGSCVNGAKGFL
jgi:hypothetical protein